MDVGTFSLIIIVAFAAADAEEANGSGDLALSLDQAKLSGRFNDVFGVVKGLENEVIALIRKQEQYEKKIVQQENEFSVLKRQCSEMENDVKELKQKAVEQEDEINSLKRQAIERENGTLELQKETDEQVKEPKRTIDQGNDSDELKRENAVEKLKKAPEKSKDDIHVKDRRSQERVAFTCYLSQEQQHTGIGQKIKYDAIQLNEGNGYNPHLGAFVARNAGLYLFAYTIGAYRGPELDVRLMKNGMFVNSASVDVQTLWADEHASNVALIQLDVGDVVYVEEYVHGDGLIYGDQTYRWTTFSGVLL